jgi:hypothetical protein
LHQIKQVADAPLDIGLGRTLGTRPGAQAEGNVLEHVHVLEQGVALEDKADAPFAQGQLSSVDIVEQHAAMIQLFEAGNGAQQGRFAGA